MLPFQIHNEIGQGKFGTVYLGTYMSTKEKVAIKCEHLENEIKILKHETHILHYLYKEGCRSVPFVYWFGTFNNHISLVMTYYDCSIDQYIKQKISTTKTPIIFMYKIIQKCIQLLELVHSFGIVHRDVKPENIMIKKNQFFLIDFGMSTFYKDGANQHIPQIEKQNIIGSPLYISYFVYTGCEPVRRDDLISLGYMMMQWLQNILPWDVRKNDIDPNQPSMYSRTHILHPYNVYISKKKEWQYISTYLIANDPLFTYLRYCYRIPFHGTPDYIDLIELFDTDDDNDNER